MWLAVVGLLVAGCSDPADDPAADDQAADDPAADRGSVDGAEPESTAAPVGDDPELSDRPCTEAPDDLELTVRCHWLEVPADRERPEAGTVRLAVAVLESPTADADDEPIVNLQGGPGFPSLTNLSSFVNDVEELGRDVVLYDQRGIGLSEPLLACPEQEEAVVRNLGRDQAYEVELADFRDAVLACRTRLIDEGVDLDSYDTETSAADLADLRIALDVERWYLWGPSYGGRLALATMRSHPEGIAGAVLDSVYPPSGATVEAVLNAAAGAIEAFIAGCADDPACAEEHPDLEATIDEVQEQYNATPFEGTVDLGEPRGTVPIVITGDDIYVGLAFALRDTALIPQLPTIAADLARGETDIIPLVAQEAVPFATRAAAGVLYSVDCADVGDLDAGRSAALVEDPGRAAGLIVYQGHTFCDGWDVEPLGDAFREPVRSDIPALVLAGTYDPITPPDYSRAASDALTDATYVEFEGFGHVVGLSTDCSTELIASFLDDPTAELDTSCVPTDGPSFGG
ncbi:alpha/beta hydrolase [Iamia sp.]|uniref:alpha/beta hydrolase n=1 Tax=Iamia sp. TaxID=2722710 RepID=UPI002D006188|nr:alpha/beta hydrolase [Iamia sp.]HXH55967.1 alpha/beta hydrolase [Iamia sp.]